MLQSQQKQQTTKNIKIKIKIQQTTKLNNKRIRKRKEKIDNNY